MEALHPDDGEEVVGEEEHDDRGDEPRVEDDGGAEDVAEPTLHAEQRQEPLKWSVEVFVRLDRGDFWYESEIRT